LPRGDQLAFLVALRRLLLRCRNPLLEAFEVRKHQFGLDRLGIRYRIDLVLDMLDVVVFEAAQHVDDGVHLADVAEELVTEPFALRRAAHQTGDVDERKLRRDDLLAAGDARQLVQPRIGHADLADIGLDRAERIIRRLRRLRLGQRIEQGGLADIGQSDDAAFETHFYSVIPVAAPLAVQQAVRKR
jgi:hypothetical protein